MTPTRESVSRTPTKHELERLARKALGERAYVVITTTGRGPRAIASCGEGDGAEITIYGTGCEIALAAALRAFVKERR